MLNAGNSQWVGLGGQDVYGSGAMVRHGNDAISSVNWSNGWPRY